MARRRQPSGLQEAMGNPSRRPAKAPVPRKRADPRDVAISPLIKGPDFREARAIWNRLAPGLVRNNVLAPTDADVFARYCSYLAEWREIMADIKANGYFHIVETTVGGSMERMRPMAKMRENTEKRLLELEDRFGLNPRHRMAILRDMSALNVPAGDLFGWREAKEAGSDAASEPAPQANRPVDEVDDDIIGFARRPAPGGLPN